MVARYSQNWCDQFSLELDDKFRKTSASPDNSAAWKSHSSWRFKFPSSSPVSDSKFISGQIWPALSWDSWRVPARVIGYESSGHDTRNNPWTLPGLEFEECPIQFQHLLPCRAPCRVPNYGSRHQIHIHESIYWTRFSKLIVSITWYDTNIYNFHIYNLCFDILVSLWYYLFHIGLW